MTSSVPLQFAPFSSFLDAGFWHKLSENKLNHYGLDDSARTIQGFYFNGDQAGMPCRMNVEYTAFDENPVAPARCFKMTGCLRNTNTLDAFKELDKKEVLYDMGKEIWSAITSGEAIKDPALLSRFLLLTFAVAVDTVVRLQQLFACDTDGMQTTETRAQVESSDLPLRGGQDLKKYHYYYWFAFPCLCPTEDFTLIKVPQRLDTVFKSDQINLMVEKYNEFQSEQKGSQGYFIIVQTDTELVITSLENTDFYLQSGKKVIFGFADPSTLEHNPGWPLRNYLALISYQWYSKLKEVDVICFRYRSKFGNHDINSSLCLTVKLTNMKEIKDCPKCVGWEKNERQKLGPRMVNLSASMDPTRLAESAVDLNLKLMRWRLLPDLDLETVAKTKCLLLGAGTLGCNVARCLLGWGVRNITLVDNGRISFSNPVRQSLFVFDDCRKPVGGKPKAEAAAEALKAIFPGVNAIGVTLSIPMPGHNVPESAINQTKADVEKLEELISSHDAIFLLLDTRESRWLPTVMSASKHKIVICSALGFDTFLVLRHGYQSTNFDRTKFTMTKSMCIPGNQLGCYFCNDVVAPGDSTRDRTLDQQCTVSRPGMSYIASALAVELLVSILQHPEKGLAPADTSANDSHLTVDHVSPLGIVPHQIRGFLSRFQQIMPASAAFDKCTACSRQVVESYEREGFDFLLRAFNEPHYLEDLTGLSQMHQETIDAEVWDFDEDDEFSSMETS